MKTCSAAIVRCSIRASLNGRVPEDKSAKTGYRFLPKLVGSPLVGLLRHRDTSVLHLPISATWLCLSVEPPEPVHEVVELEVLSISPIDLAINLPSSLAELTIQVLPGLPLLETGPVGEVTPSFTHGYTLCRFTLWCICSMICLPVDRLPGLNKANKVSREQKYP